MRTLHRGDHGNDVRKLQQAIATRARARDAPNHVPKVDGSLGPETLADFHYVAYLLGMDTAHLKTVLKNGLTPAEQSFVMNPGKRDSATLARARKRVAAHKRVRDKQRKEAAASTAKRRRIVAAAEHAAANYRKDPGAYHYLAGGKANLVYLHPTPRDWRSDCSQFAASVYKAAGLPSPASVPHEWASTFTMVKAPGVKSSTRPTASPACSACTAPARLRITWRSGAATSSSATARRRSTPSPRASPTTTWTSPSSTRRGLQKGETMHEGSDSVHTDDPMKDVATEAKPVEDQTPPPGFEPQTELAPDQNPGIAERDGVTVEDVEAEVDSGDHDSSDGEADDGDDNAEDGEPG
jgi:hypothetical protein